MAQSSKNETNGPRHPISGSARPLFAGSNHVGALEAHEQLSVSVVLRRRQDGPPVPDLEHWQKTPPGHRRFLTPDEFEKNHGAAQADVAAVTQFATQHGLQVMEKKPGRRTVVVRGSAAQMNEAFGITLNRYDAPRPGRRSKTAKGETMKGGEAPRGVTRGGTDQPERQVHRGFEGELQIPEGLLGVVTDVVGLDNRILGGRNDGDPANTNPLPVSQIAQLYQFPNTGASGQVIGVFNGNANGGNYKPADITQCFGAQPAGYKTAPTVVPISLTVDGTTYTNDPSGFLDLEITQDIQIASIVAQGVKVNVYCTIDNEDGWLTYLNRVISPEAGDAVPSVLTSSWFLGHDGSDASTLLNTLSAKFQELASLGITAFNAQGDSGSNDGSGAATCQVQYPASDPWVTSVGGTTIGNVSGSSFDEFVWNDDTGSTGGGVSDFFATPPYQTAAGIAAVSKNDGMVRRGVPDISANASPNAGYSGIIMGGSGTIGQGTSASTPLMAGLTAVLNQALGAPIGFLNPTLYALGDSVCRDITSGDNNPSDGSGAPFYTAAAGWDACTGWGSPNGAAMLSALQTLYTQKFYFLVDKSTFGSDELSQTLVYNNAFWLVLEGFTIPQAAGAVIGFTGAFNGYAGLTITPDAAGIQYEFPGNNFTPQRILYPYDITFLATSASLFPPMGSSMEELLTATIGINGGITASTLFEVDGGADPFFQNIGPGGNEFYLSQDLRVFTITPESDGTIPFGTTAFNFTGGSATVADTAAAYNYIQALLGELSSGYGDPGAMDPFSSLLPDQGGALTGDGSVTPETTNPHGSPFINYNFAIAKVRLNGTGSNAANTKVFFRLFNTQTFDTDYVNTNAFVSLGDPDITFPSTGSADSPQAPLPGTDKNGNINGSSIPFFAAADQSDLLPGGVNNQSLTVITADGLWAYYGCYLDVYDPSLTIGSQQVQFWLAGGSHHCLVAQIAYDGAPIQNEDGVILNPNNCDKLAQRNLQITGAGTSNIPAARLVPQTFNMRPSPLSVLTSKIFLVNQPDEMMIDWGNVPAGSTASLYWPDVNAADVVALAVKRFGVPFLSVVDTHTVRCKVVSGMTYIPIPTGTATTRSFAGLFTLELPAGSHAGMQYNITVRRITSRQIGQPGGAGRQVASGQTINWRYVSGAFVIRIPVASNDHLLAQEENLLAILKWRQLLLPASNKWSPILLRWATYVAARVKAFGGNPSQIGPSRTGYFPPVGIGSGHHNGAEEFIGKVHGLIFDRFGDFEGFSFETKEGKRLHFVAHEKRIEEIVRRAWADRILLEIKVDPAEPHSPAQVVLLESVGV